MRHTSTTLATTALLLLCGCGASRRAVSSDTATKSEATSSVHAGAAQTVAERSATRTQLSGGEQLLTQITEFDTTLPTDPATGTPPIKRRIVHAKRAAAAIRHVTATGTDVATTTVIDSAASAAAETIVHTRDQTRKGLNTFQSLLCVAGFASLSGVTLLLAAKLRRR